MTAGTLTEVVIEPRSPDPLIRALNYAPNGNGDLAAQIGARLAGRTIWNVNSTATGGGVAEMLPSLIGYARGMGVDTRWLVIGGTPDFFALTKRLHHALHGSRGDASALASSQRAVYEEVLRPSAEAMVRTVRPGDAVVLHDPQTAGLAPQLVKVGARVIWRCHIGYERWNEHTQAGWDFLAPYLDCVPAYVFSRRAYAPVHFDARRCHVIAPSIDPAAAKNEDLADAVVRSVLVQTGLLAGTPGGSEFVFSGANGGERRVHRAVRFMTDGPPPAPDAPLVLQVSRWDPLKDPCGVMHGFARLVVDGVAPRGAQLMLAGPSVEGVADDPEAADVLAETVAAWRVLPQPVRRLIHLVSLPTDDREENSLIVNALQRHATVVVQKSLREGFGLTVAEAMWKARPVLASAVGGIQDQIEDGVSGVLLRDPSDLDAFARELRALLDDSQRAARLGLAAKERVRSHYLSARHLEDYATLLAGIDAAVDS